MAEEVEPISKPLAAGQLLLSAEERKEFPNNVMFQAHVSDVTLDDFGQGERLGVTFVVDQDGEFKDQHFKKWFSKIATPRAGFTKLVQTLVGEMPEELDPTIIKGLPLQVMFQADSFEGKAYQKAVYLPPVKGQKKVEPDVILEDIEEGQDNAAALEAALDVLNAK